MTRPELSDTPLEDQYSITEWADKTFGEVQSNLSIAHRAEDELVELILILGDNDADPRASVEIADVVIVLYRLASKLGVDLHDEIDKKMAINRARKWRLDGAGQGQHIKDDE